MTKRPEPKIPKKFLATAATHRAVCQVGDGELGAFTRVIVEVGPRLLNVVAIRCYSKLTWCGETYVKSFLMIFKQQNDSHRRCMCSMSGVQQFEPMV
jgi:hypothetical protein